MLASALEHYRHQQLIQLAGLTAARKARRKGVAHVAQIVALFQILAARDAVQGVGNMLDEQGIEEPPVAHVTPVAFAGTASDGRPLGSLLEQAETDYQFGLIVATQLKDMARMAAGVAITTRPGIGSYTRMLNPPSCSRCTVLAGKVYKWNDGFQRHPGCDCLHVPTRDARFAEREGLVLDQDAYFESLPTAESLNELHPDLTVKMRREAGIYSQEDVFTKAGARAIRDGADMNQIVNVRRGMSTAQINSRGWIPKGRLTPVQIGGRDVFVSSEGVTRRGLASRERTGRNMGSRLMPESIYANATSRDDALRMLKLHGYITP